MAEGQSQALGSIAGRANVIGKAKHTIRHYCPDYGYIMCIMTIIPDPAYSQILPKHFLYRDRLDFPFPVFNNISMQPITYEEFAPLQSAFAGDGAKVTDTFGYQRPNHDLVWFPDTVHGQFRTSFKDYLIARQFAGRPELSDDFLKIDKQSANNIFQYQEGDDICFGQLAFDIKGKRPLPRVVIPGIGR